MCCKFYVDVVQDSCSDLAASLPKNNRSSLDRTCSRERLSFNKELHETNRCMMPTENSVNED